MAVSSEIWPDTTKESLMNFEAFSEVHTDPSGNKTYSVTLKWPKSFGKITLMNFQLIGQSYARILQGETYVGAGFLNFGLEKELDSDCVWELSFLFLSKGKIYEKVVQIKNKLSVIDEV